MEEKLAYEAPDLRELYCAPTVVSGESALEKLEEDENETKPGGDFE